MQGFGISFTNLNLKRSKWTHMHFLVPNVVLKGGVGGEDIGLIKRLWNERQEAKRLLL